MILCLCTECFFFCEVLCFYIELLVQFTMFVVLQLVLIKEGVCLFVHTRYNILCKWCIEIVFFAIYMILCCCCSCSCLTIENHMIINFTSQYWVQSDSTACSFGQIIYITSSCTMPCTGNWVYLLIVVEICIKVTRIICTLN